MYEVNIKDMKVLLDDKKTYDELTFKGKRKMWVDTSNKNSPYAQVWRNGKNVRIHHLILGKPKKGMMVGHLNGNSLDNRRCNLKFVSRSENQYNVKRKTGECKRWVTKTKSGKYIASFRIHLGTFKTEDEAHQAAVNYFKKNFKDFYLHEDFIT